MASVRAQTYRDFELVVQDAKSSDGTVEYLRTIDDFAIDLVSEPDAGHGDAYNRALRRVRGEIVGTIDADNLLQPSSLADAVAYIDEHPGCAAVVGAAMVVTEDGALSWMVTPEAWDLEQIMRAEIVPRFLLPISCARSVETLFASTTRSSGARTSISGCGFPTGGSTSQRRCLVRRGSVIRVSRAVPRTMTSSATRRSTPSCDSSVATWSPSVRARYPRARDRGHLLLGCGIGDRSRRPFRTVPTIRRAGGRALSKRASCCRAPRAAGRPRLDPRLEDDNERRASRVAPSLLYELLMGSGGAFQSRTKRA